METHECVPPESKVCKKCDTRKSLSDFSLSKGKYVSKCKSCLSDYQRDYYQRNRDKVIARTVAYTAANKDLQKQRQADWYKKNKEAYLAKIAEYRKLPEVAAHEAARQRAYYEARKSEIQKKRKQALESDAERKRRFDEYQERYYKENYHFFLEKSVRRNRMIDKATPAWADLSAIRSIYKKCKEISLLTGVLHVVDHIVPLKGRTVCGFHVESNLRIITAKENLKKFNKLTEG